MRTEVAYVGKKVRVRQEHRILERRGMVGEVVGRYGGKSTWSWMCASRIDCVGCFGPRTLRRSLLQFVVACADSSKLEPLRQPCR
jgi:hypothetical protein